MSSTGSWIIFNNDKVRDWNYYYFLESNIAAFQLPNASLGSSGQDLNCACALYESIYGYIQSLCSTYSDIEKKAIDFTETDEYEKQRRRKRKRNRIHDNECNTSSCAGPLAPIQTSFQRFERTVFFAIIDNLLVALSKQ